MLHMTPPLQRGVTATHRNVCKVAIIGGGFSGASLARLLALGGCCNGDPVLVFEPREDLGTGLAYDTHDPALRLNVEATRMRALPDDPEAFARWLALRHRQDPDPAATVGESGTYARRSDFGRFMAEQMRPFLENGSVCHIRERVEKIERAADRWRLTGTRGTEVLADIVVIATTHPRPCAPETVAAALTGHPRFLPDASRTQDLRHIASGDRVLIIGSGLTACDVIASLRHRGHHGEITSLSRSGLLPQPQASGQRTAVGNFVLPTATTAQGLLRRVRLAIREAERAGLAWQNVFDALRQQAQTIWQALPLGEQKRLLRHLRRRFETHRYRMSPQVAELLHHERQQGRFVTRAGRIGAVEAGPQTVSIDLIAKPDGTVERRQFEWVVLATGPGAAIPSLPYLADLERLGHIKADAHQLGLACDRGGRAIGAGGQITPGLFVAGPLTRGTFGELTGVPEIAAQCERLATEIIATIGGDRSTFRNN